MEGKMMRHWPTYAETFEHAFCLTAKYLVLAFGPYQPRLSRQMLTGFRFFHGSWLVSRTRRGGSKTKVMQNTNLPPANVPDNLSKSFFFFYDDTSGWLKVLRTDLQLLDLTQKVSKHSKQSGKWVYLQEDHDVQMFTKAWLIMHGQPETNETYFEQFMTIQYDGRVSWIRTLKNFKP